jgi:steroid delta-isomerase-like uncharacterized protein
MGIIFVPTRDLFLSPAIFGTTRQRRPQRHDHATGNELNKEVVRRIVEEMFNFGKLDVAFEIFAPDFVDRGHEQVADKKDGPEGFAQFVKTVRSALPDIRATIQNMTAEGDYVAMWNTATATHRGDLFGMPASGKRINMKDFHFFRFSNGKIVEHWNSVSLS